MKVYRMDVAWQLFNKQERKVCTGRHGGSSAVATPLGEIPGKNAASEIKDR